MSDASRELFDNYTSHYNRGSENYFRPSGEVNTFHLERLPRWMEGMPRESRILDAGCATGYTLELLQAAGFEAISGVDVSAQLVEQARAKLGDAVPLHVSGLAEFLASSADESYDAILFHHVIEHIPRDQTIALLRDFHRCLAQGGMLGIRTPNADCLMCSPHANGDFTHLVNFNERSLRQVLEAAGFGSEAIAFQIRPPRLYFSWRHPIRMVLRVLNRLRWSLNALVHRALYVLADIHPLPLVFDGELESVARR